MEPETRYTVIGAVVLALIAAAVFGYLWLSSSGRAADFHYYTIYFEKQSLAGLQVGGNVNMRGITVGRVEDYSLSRDNINRVKVDLRVTRDTPVRVTTRAAVSRNVLTGIAHINLDTPNAHAPELVEVRKGERYPVIAEGTSNLDQIADSVTRLAQSATTSFDRAGVLLSDDNVRIFSELMVSVRDLAQALNARLGSIETAARGVDDTARVIQKSVRELAGSMQQVVTRLQPLPQQAGDTLVAAQDSLREFTSATRSLEQRLNQAIDRLQSGSDGLVRRADDALDVSVLELRATAADLRSSAELVGRTLDQLRSPRAALVGPSAQQLGPGERAP
jgi:phospholipid/cholesterol/gamma-HCH transport system substrate-binding protein